MSLYRKKPIVVEARQLTRENIGSMEAWCGGKWRSGNPNPRSNMDDMPEGLYLRTPESGGYTQIASIGDYIIRGAQGEFCRLKPNIFAATYEAVDEER